MSIVAKASFGSVEMHGIPQTSVCTDLVCWLQTLDKPHPANMRGRPAGGIQFHARKAEHMSLLDSTVVG